MIRGTMLLCAWWAYRRGFIRLLDLRVWLACFELTARRCGLKNGKSARYTIDELHRLVGGVGGEHIRASLRRLERYGLLAWSESKLIMGSSLDVLSGLEAERPLDETLSLVSNHNRLVPVPRRTLRFLAGGASRAVIATCLGHLLRCLYYRDGQCLPEGRCKASWVSDVFDVSLRNVKVARSHLVELGWLHVKPAPQRSLNRWGAVASVNLAWSRTTGEASRGLTPPRPFSTTESSPPIENKKLSSRSENQKPADRGPSGVSGKQGRDDAPTFQHVTRQDLYEPARLEKLHHDARRLGLVADSECDRLRFFAAAEHAIVVGTKNPCGLFAAIVRRGLWGFITQGDEDVARQKLRHLGEGQQAERSRGMGAAPPDEAFTCPAERVVVDDVSKERLRIRETVLQSLGLSQSPGMGVGQTAP